MLAWHQILQQTSMALFILYSLLNTIGTRIATPFFDCWLQISQPPLNSQIRLSLQDMLALQTQISYLFIYIQSLVNLPAFPDEYRLLLWRPLLLCQSVTVVICSSFGLHLLLDYYIQFCEGDTTKNWAAVVMGAGLLQLIGIIGLILQNFGKKAIASHQYLSVPTDGHAVSHGSSDNFDI